MLRIGQRSELNNRTVRVLLVDDDEEDCIITRKLLSKIEGWCIDVQWVSTYNTALEAIGASHYDVCLVVENSSRPIRGIDELSTTRPHTP